MLDPFTVIPLAGGLPRRRRLAVLSARTLAVDLILLGMIVGILMFVVPRLEVVFKDAGVALPGVTVWVLNAGQAIHNYGVLYGLVAFAGLLLAKEFVIPSASFKLAINVAVWLVVLAGVILLVVGILLPLPIIEQSLTH